MAFPQVFNLNFLGSGVLIYISLHFYAVEALERCWSLIADHFHVYLGSWFELNLLKCSIKDNLLGSFSLACFQHLRCVLFLSECFWTSSMWVVVYVLWGVFPLSSKTESHVTVNSMFANDLKISWSNLRVSNPHHRPSVR